MRAGHTAGATAHEPSGTDEPGSERIVHLAPEADLVPDSILTPPFRGEGRGLLRDLAALLVDRHLRRLARMRNPVEWRLARLLLRVDESSGYLDLGFSSLLDYAAERLGLRARRVRMLVALARRLRDLPGTAAAFEDGRISESQVRLLLRVVTPETEAAWIEKAAVLKVRLLEREVRAALVARAESIPPSRPGDGVEPPADEDDATADGETIGIMVPARLRARWEEAVELARRSSGSPDPVWRCAEFIAADYLAGVPDLAGVLARSFDDDAAWSLTGDAAAVLTGEVQSFAADSCLDDRHDARAGGQEADLFEDILRVLEEETGVRRLTPSAEELDVVLPGSVQDDPADAPRRLDDRLLECVRLRQNLAWHQGRLLRLFAGRRLYRELGFLSFSRYCRERAGLGVRRAWQLIALERRLWLLPEIARAYRSGSLSWVKAAAIARIADEKTEREWLHLARSVTVRRLLDEVAVARAEADNAMAAGGPTCQSTPPGFGDPTRPGRPPGLDPDGGVQLSAPALRAGTARPDSEPEIWTSIRFWAPQEVASLWHQAIRVCRLLAQSAAADSAPAVADRPLGDWECLDRVLDSFFTTWAVRRGTAWQRRYRIFERDGWRCRVPACSSRRSLHVHHVLFRSRGGGDDDANLAVLCATHHLQGLHRGRLRCHALPGGLLAWELGCDPVRGPVARYVEDVAWDAVRRPLSLLARPERHSGEMQARSGTPPDRMGGTRR